MATVFAPAPSRRIISGPSRRIIVHDYAGHMFPAQLSRWLAGQGHRVLHLYSADVETPRGRLSLAADDPPGFAVEAVSCGRKLDKYALARRWMQEMAYGARLSRRVAAFQPDVILSANAPPAVQAGLQKGAARNGTPLICWVQDIFTVGVDRVLAGAPAPARWAARRFLGWVEFGVMRAAAGLVVISPDFLSVLAACGVRHPRSHVIENWAPYGEIVARPKDNEWARAHGLADKFVFLCSGTLGMKHNPAHLANLARAFRADPTVRIVVVSQGLGRRWLEEVKAAEGLDNLTLFDFQPAGTLSDVLATGDVAVLLLEAYAGVLSVPSKIYSYLCAARPILGALPADNLACRRVDGLQAGLCVAPEDQAGFVAAARRLRDDPGLRAVCAANQTTYAARAFDIGAIGRRFEQVLEEACDNRQATAT